MQPLLLSSFFIIEIYDTFSVNLHMHNLSTAKTSTKKQTHSGRSCSCICFLMCWLIMESWHIETGSHIKDTNLLFDCLHVFYFWKSTHPTNKKSHISKYFWGEPTLCQSPDSDNLPLQFCSTLVEANAPSVLHLAFDMYSCLFTSLT